MSDNGKHNAIEKALAILGLFAFNNQELGTLEISRELGYHKATTSRTLILLAEYGFLEQNERNRKYRLGPRIVNLGLVVTRSLKHNLIQIATPYLEDLRNRIQETVVLEVLSGKRTITAYIAEGPSIVQLGGQVGDLMPSFVTSGLKAILACSSPSEWEEFIEQGLVQRTPNSITDPDLFRKHLEQTRISGIAVDNGEHDIELHAVSAPVFNIEGKPVAAVNAVGLARRIETSVESKTAREVKRTAETISKKLYYSDKEAESLDQWLESLRVEK